MENQSRNGIDFVDLLYYFKNKILIILASLVVFALGSFITCKFIMTPKYTATSSIYVLNRSNDSNVVVSDIQISQELLNDYKVLITSKNVTKEVIRDLKLDMTPGQLAEKIEVTSPSKTRVLQINVHDTDPKRATDIANHVWKVAAFHLKQIMDVDAVNLVYEADLPTSPSSPNVLTNTIIGGVIGLFGAIIVLAIIFILDDKIKKEEDAQYYLNLNTLGVVPYERDLDEQANAKKKR